MKDLCSKNIMPFLSCFASEDAVLRYAPLLKNVEAACEETVAKNAAAADRKGVSCAGNQVILPDEMLENISALEKTGYLGSVLPEKWGGKALPKLFDSAATEMISAADASLMTLVSLQEIGKVIELCGTEEQKERLLPGICSGKLGCAMALSETGAGSDLQAVKTRAFEENGCWYLDGTKHFVTNGGADVILVLARSEEGSTDGRGLSLFLYERAQDNNCEILKTEEKHGICASPTCTLRFSKARCELLGRRRFGLIKHVLDLLLGARLSVSAQAVGIADAALFEAEKYASSRMQFGKKIGEIPQVSQMIRQMRYDTESARLMLYFASAKYDEWQRLLALPQEGSVPSEVRKARSAVDFIVPMLKFLTAETAECVSHDSLQIHGGVGYLKGTAAERLCRDARVTSIYEGTSQIQASMLTSGIAKGALSAFVRDLEKKADKNEALFARAAACAEDLEKLAALCSRNGSLQFCEAFFAGAASAVCTILVRAAYFPKPASDAFEPTRILIAKAEFFSSAIRTSLPL